MKRTKWSGRTNKDIGYIKDCCESNPRLKRLEKLYKEVKEIYNEIEEKKPINSILAHIKYIQKRLSRY
jgi:hypothetical protein